MTIVLHIGVSKTGSSAIQFGLAQHQRALGERGLHYALDNAEMLVDRRLVASGNGAELAQWLKSPPDGHFGLTAAAFDREFVSEAHPLSLVSCETLSAARTDLLARFRDEIVGERPIRIVAFVRDLYGHAMSSWMQRIKRHGYTGQFPHFCAKAYGNKQCAALRTYAEVFGPERMSVIHYGRLRRSPFHAMLRALDLPSDDLQDPPRLNRSLTAAEAQILIACNALHRNQGELSARISDHLIHKHPDRPTHSMRSAGAARTLGERFSGDIDWVNRTFFPTGPGLAVGEGAAAAPATPEEREEVWADAVEALGRRLVSTEAQNRKLRTAIQAFEPIEADRAALREALDKLRSQSWLERLKLDLARRLRRGA